jgi:hypothetical protein
VSRLSSTRTLLSNRVGRIDEDLAMRRAALVTVAAVSVWTVGGLWLDAQVGRSGQLLLGLLTCAVLAGLLSLHPRAVRLQALAVVAVATVGEIIGSLVWGLYTYRLDNLPAFVPPGHGLVYLCGFSLATLMARRPSVLLGVASAGAAVWGIAGVTVLPATDLSGAVGCAFLVAVLLKTRRSVYAGVFVVVAALELYGTAVGTWTWEGVVPGLGLTQGNPPSGVASGYVVFDVVAIWLTTRAGRSTLRGIRTRVQAFAAGF